MIFIKSTFSKIILLSFIGLTGLLLYLFYAFYLPKIHFHQPLNIKISGLSAEKTKKITVYGITPFGNVMALYPSALVDSNTETGLFSTVYLDLTRIPADSITQINVKTGEKLFSLLPREIQSQLKTSDLPKKIFFLPNRIQDDNRLSSKIHSILALSLIKCLPVLFSLFMVGLLLAQFYKRWHAGINRFVVKYGSKFHVSIYALCVFGGCLFMAQFSYPDKVELTGDAVDYQSIAVNLIYGHGFPKDGGMEDSSVYKFYVNPEAIGAQNWQSFYFNKGHFYFYRNPVYMLFIAGVYNMFSVSPAMLYKVQFLLLILSGSLLPYIGYRMLGIKGISVGCLSFAVFLFADYHYAFAVYTEALCISYILVFLLAHLTLNYKHKIFHAVIFGLLLGFGLLLKNCFMPLFWLWIGYLFYESFMRKTIPVRNTMLVICASVLIILPWTVYANIQNTSPGMLLITTQGDDVLLASNNEYAEDGDWHPEWTEKSESFYNQPKLKKFSAFKKVGLFYQHYPALMVKIFPAKFRKGLMVTFPQLLFYITLALFLLGRFINRAKQNTSFSNFISFGIIFGLTISYLILSESIWKLLNVLLYSLPKTALTVDIMVTILGVSTSWYCIRLIKQHQAGHLFLSLLLLNFLILTLVFYGSERIEGVIDFAFLLLAFQLLFDWLNAEEVEKDSPLSTPLQ